MSKHTPGPWENLQTPDGQDFVIASDRLNALTAIHRSPEAKLANARLMAAAPDMLDALIHAVDEYYANDYCGAPDAPAVPEWVRNAESAIAKAGGIA